MNVKIGKDEKHLRILSVLNVLRVLRAEDVILLVLQGKVAPSQIHPSISGDIR
jgi:hypothetical protein